MSLSPGSFARVFVSVTLLLAGLAACGPGPPGPTIRFTTLPPGGEGSPDKLFDIAGKVEGAQRSGLRLVLFAHAGVWWVQPTREAPFTDLTEAGEWRSHTHPGTEYAALLVTDKYAPPATIGELPKAGGDILSVATAKGYSPQAEAPKIIRFSGYDWEARNVASDRGGTRNQYRASNVWTDSQGLLHLRLTREEKEWTSAELKLTRSLGYGSYRFVVRDITQLEPASVFSIFTWDESQPAAGLDIEISRWGEPRSRNAQYVVQPYYIPANTVRFEAPSGTLSHWLEWQPGHATFRTARGASSVTAASALVDEHSFRSGVPPPGKERISLNLYRFENPATSLQRDCEVVVERFEYLP